jgi:DNA repair protein RecO (recombination protein O)
MPMLAKDEAICIRALDYSETSQIVTFFTKATGKITAIAKGSKRPKSAFDGPIEVFSYGKIVFSDSSREKLATLTEFEQQPGFSNLRNNLFALNCCLFGAELLNSLTKDYDPHPQLFDSFLQYLQNTNECRASLVRRSFSEGGSIEHRDTLAYLILFQLTLLKEVGLMPILDYCVNCKTSFEQRLSAVAPALHRTQCGGGLAKAEESSIEHRVYFSSTANGLICRDCEASFQDKIVLSKNAAACLANLKLLAQSQEKTLQELEKLLIYHFTNILNRPPKMAKHILKA